MRFVEADVGPKAISAPKLGEHSREILAELVTTQAI